MSSRKLTSSMTNFNLKPLQASMTLIAFALLVLLNCIDFSSTLSIPSPTNQESPTISNKDPVATADESLNLSQPEKRSRQYNFGLGKRQNGEFETDDLRGISNKDLNSIVERMILQKLYGNANDDEQNSFRIKRSKPQRFSFGLGKRAMEEVYGQDDDAIGTGDNQLPMESDYAAEKRKAQRYQFGIGKRWFSAINPAGNKKVSSFDEFMKRRYSFGLGK